MSVLNGNYVKPDTNLRFQSLYLDGDIDCNAIHARSIVPDPTNDLVCNKLTSNIIENSGNITTNSIVASGNINTLNLISGVIQSQPESGMVDNPDIPYPLDNTYYNHILTFTDITLPAFSHQSFCFSWGSSLNISNYSFTANIVNVYANQVDNVPITASIANTFGVFYTGVKRVSVINPTNITLNSARIDILISLVKSHTQ